jgi:polyisoprenyl-phosphate glycosyltransferase
MKTHVAIVLPVFNDWASFSALVADLSTAAEKALYRISIVVVDDGSTDAAPDDLFSLGELRNVDSIELVRLALNVGHQRALAIGLCSALQNRAIEQFVLMDADGEDRPQDIEQLMKSAALHPEAITVAMRRKRNETFLFRTFYQAYKLAFRLLTGKQISFGNFCLLSRDQAERLSMVPDLWNNLPAAVMRSRLPVERVAIDRGRRYFGSSKMNFVSLSLHGMSAYSVYTDAILVRLLIITFCIGGAGALLIAFVAVLRLFTTLATPGWGTTVFFGTAIIVSQAAFTTLMTALLLLNNRSQKLIVPAVECTHYIRSRTMVPFHHAATSGGSAPVLEASLPVNE